MPKSIIDLNATKENAINELNDFIDNRLHSYESMRNYDLGENNHQNVSLLSPYIRHRLITEQEVVSAALNKFPLPKIEKFIQEVLWRTYWKGWLELRPRVWDDYKDNIRINNDKKQLLEKVLSYETDIDCFNVWTKELVETNYLHNHARMWYASIWIHTLKLPWEAGANLFLKHLLDGDPASNTLSWRWVAGVQTKNKSYLAKHWNIQKFTKNRINPPEEQFSTTQTNILYKEYLPQSVKYNESKIVDWSKAGLLMTCEDIDVLSCSKIPFPINNAYALPLCEEEYSVYADNVISFKENSLSNYSKLLSESIKSIEVNSSHDNQIELICSWAQNNKITEVVCLATPRGYMNDFINNLKIELDKKDIKFIKLYRDYDMKYWNLASASFFNFFKKAIQKI